MEPPTTQTHAERPLVVGTPAFTADRVSGALRSPAHWRQLVKFGCVGASGFVVNNLVFAACTGPLGWHYIAAATAAFCVAAANNFTWNRLWTFRTSRHESHVAFQAARFVAVSAVILALNYALLWVFIERVDLHEQVAQLIAVSILTPFSFLANKLWSFR